MRETEVPEIFSLWGGIMAVSACLGRGHFIDQGHFEVYPNLYVILTAGSAKCRKSTIISVIEKLLREVEPSIHVLSQKSTPEALIFDMCGMAPEGDNFVASNATGIIIADEVSTFIDRNAFQTGMIAILTKLYDCQDFDYRTRSRGQEMVKDPCLSLLGGSTIQWIKEAIPVVSIGGGFTARIIFVFQDRRNKNVPWAERSHATVALREKIIHDLCEIKNLTKGRFVVTEEAKDLYCSEYNQFSDQSKFFEDPNMSGYAGRRHVMILKLAMCFSASMNDSREITKVDMARAINTLSQSELNMTRVLSAISAEPCGDLSEQLVNLLASKRKISRYELMRCFRHKLTVTQLDELLRVLIEARYITSDIEGSQAIYRWIGDKK